MSFTHDARKAGTSTSKAVCIVLLFIFISVLPIMAAGGTSRQDWSVAIEKVPVLKEDSKYTFSCSVPGASNETIPGLTFSWDFGDKYANASNPNKVSVTGLLTASHLFTHPGTYSIALTVTDGKGNLSSASTKATVENQAPTPGISIDRKSTFEDEPITFIASGQLDTPSDLAGLTYSWAFDSEQASGFSSTNSATRTYQRAGSHTVKLAVKDEHGAESSVTVPFSVDNQPPLAIAGKAISASEGRPITFIGKGIDTPSDMPTLTFAWDFGDGTAGTGAQAIHVYGSSGRFTAWLTVTDDDGASTRDPVVVNVEDLAPVAKATAVQVGGSDFVVFDASGSTDSASDMPKLIYDWIFDDKDTATGKVVTHRFRTIGDHSAHLMVMDPSGKTGETDVTVNVARKSPTITLRQVGAVWEDQPFTMTADIVKEAGVATVDVMWELDSQGSQWHEANSSTVSSTFTIRSTETHTIRVSVRGPGGATAFSEISVKPQDMAPKGAFTSDWLTAVGKGVTFDASPTVDTESDQPTLDYDWSFGDDSFADGKVVVHTFTATGDYSVILTVTDNSGLKSTVKKVLTVISSELLARMGDRILAVEFSVSDMLDGEPGITSGEVISVSGTIRPADGWDGPDLLTTRTAKVTVHVAGLQETWSTTTKPDGTFSLNVVAPPKAGKFTIRVVAEVSPLTTEAVSNQEVKKEPAAPVSMTVPIIAGVSTAAAGLIAVGAVGGTDLGRWKFFTLLIPLFTRLRKPKVLDHFERGRIYEHIRKTPGDSYSSIRKALGLKNGALAHHLRVLEAHDYIVSRRDGMYRRFYPKGMKIPEGKHKSIQEQMLEMIMSNPRITQKEMAERLGIDRSTVNYHIKILLAMGVIRSEKDGKVKYYYFVGIKEPLPFEG